VTRTAPPAGKADRAPSTPPPEELADQMADRAGAGRCNGDTPRRTISVRVASHPSRVLDYQMRG
jgi:hypothetical protein